MDNPQISDKVLLDLFSRLDLKIDNITTRIAFIEGGDVKETLKSIDQRLKHLEDKVNRIDKNQAVLYGIVAFVGALAGIIGTYIKSFFTGGN